MYPSIPYGLGVNEMRLENWALIRTYRAIWRGMELAKFRVVSLVSP